MLREYGLFLGDVSMKSRYNPKGNQESFEVRDIDESLLKNSGGSWFEPVTVDPKNIDPFLSLRIQRFRKLMERKQQPWGFKDPRMLFCIDAWQQPGDLTVGSFRHPAAVVRSLARRNNTRKGKRNEKKDAAQFIPFSDDEWAELWFKYNQQLVRLYREKSFPIVNF